MLSPRVRCYFNCCAQPLTKGFFREAAATMAPVTALNESDEQYKIADTNWSPEGAWDSFSNWIVNFFRGINEESKSAYPLYAFK